MMNYSKILTLLLFAFFISSCGTETTSTADDSKKGETKTDTTEKPAESKPEKADNWLVVPGEKVGRIQSTFSGADIHKTFGDANVRKMEIGLGEGETTMGMVVFPKTKNELQIIFEGDKMGKISSINIKGEGSMWKTAEGIQVGTTLEDLVKLNGKDFKFFGFEWDYAGRLASWEDGKLSKNLSVDLEPTNEEAVFPDLLGDREFLSSHPKATAAGLKVISLTVRF